MKNKNKYNILYIIQNEYEIYLKKKNKKYLMSITIWQLLFDNNYY